MRVTELLLHPVRLRIVQAVFDGSPFTTLQLRERLPDVSRATMYRQVEILLEGGLLEIESEARVHGAVERRYRLLAAQTLIDRDTAEAMTLDEHRHGFAAATASLLGEFAAYLDQEGADPKADLVSYKQIPLWLSDKEKADLIDAVMALLQAHAGNPQSPGRRRHLLATIFFPTEKKTNP
ncbi:helix-turn-helix domain-containing protein [Kribbella sp. NBC_01245]|uniref:helix-turn-helix domain-containing protein n=1 Tax=Kribbella sp. NBC_01245 TaxID=2903578 RepID=UPI002E2B31B7|nr:helix-turn-helix domain-containing protein [Kribbella sp. NBC_01245]